jgi:ferrochelatase
MPSGNGARVAVLLCGYGEPEDYESFADWNELSLRLLVAKSVPVPERAIPWLAGRLERRVRKEWASAGNFVSPHNRIFEAQREGVQRVLRARYGDRVAVFKAYSFLTPFLPQVALREIRDAGFDRLALVPLMVVDSIYTSGIVVEQVNAAFATDGAWLADKRYLPGFGTRPEYHDLLAEHVVAGVEPLRARYAASQVGVVLLDHGLPLSTKRGWETGYDESRLLYEAVRERLAGRFPLVSIGWMNHPVPGKWTKPDMDTAAENLLSLGARALAFAPIGFVTDNHETILDVDNVRRKVRGRAETIRIDSLNDDERFLELAAGWIAPLIDDLS